MKVNYFKLRKRFDFSPHPYDIGNAFGPWKRTADSHFLLKIYKLDEGKFEEYYNYHLQHTLDNHIADEEEFFGQVWQLVDDRISYFRSKDPFDASHQNHLDNIAKLQQFQHFLDGIDQWNARPSHIVIDEKEKIIHSLKIQIKELQSRLDELKVFEVGQKIRIEEGYVPTLIDILKQVEQLELPSGRKLILSDHQIIYPRMIGKYFSDGGDDIPVETLRNYYVGTKGDVTAKGTEIRPEHKLFKIVPIDPANK
ncbi:hypothetical protein [Pedobacter nanyangensis]|uniref:hypothetical protein n=1 Tax=Pedobacter nanyangensis TaxID=1562389 RepID=UPI000DE36D74|nr:hypothetical protein [Pedobacter nanyangensis]